MSVRESRFIGWHNLEMFAVPSRECDVFYQAAQDVWCKFKSSHASSIPALAVFMYMAYMIWSKMVLGRGPGQKVAKV